MEETRGAQSADRAKFREALFRVVQKALLEFVRSCLVVLQEEEVAAGFPQLIVFMNTKELQGEGKLLSMRTPCL